MSVSYESVPEGFTFAGAALVFGRSGDQQWTLPVGPDAVGTGIEPTKVTMTGSVVAGDLEFSPTRAELLPWSCYQADDGSPRGTGRTAFAGIGRSKLSLVLTGTVRASSRLYPGDVTSASRPAERERGGELVVVQRLSSG